MLKLTFGSFGKNVPLMLSFLYRVADQNSERFFDKFNGAIYAVIHEHSKTKVKFKPKEENVVYCYMSQLQTQFEFQVFKNSWQKMAERIIA